MSDQSIILYGGKPVRFPEFDLVDAKSATVFPDATAAYQRITDDKLSHRHAHVVNLERYLVSINPKIEGDNGNPKH